MRFGARGLHLTYDLDAATGDGHAGSAGEAERQPLGRTIVFTLFTRDRHALTTVAGVVQATPTTDRQLIARANVARSLFVHR